MVRTELREHIFKMLFQIEFNTLEEMPKHLELYFEELTSAKEKDKEYIQKKLEAVIEKLEEIDAILNEKAMRGVTCPNENQGRNYPLLPEFFECF